ncbi:MAG: beta-ketoacyl-[Lachnospiraceae bacterium]|nr:beta-ketoacyl-[acyl-carrier-protein] synthase II [Lachnospiraceae bacterium]
AFHITSPAEDGSGAATAMLNALKDGGVDPSDLTYINAHGTGTPMNDALETQAIKLALGEEKAKASFVSSTKSMTGHMLGAAGAIEALACIMALKENILPPTINLNEPDEKCDLNYIPNKSLNSDITLALSNSLGFGGHNACLAFRKA